MVDQDVPIDETPVEAEVVEAEVVEAEVVDAGVVEEAEVDPLEQARLEAASHLDDLRRLKAEFENYRKRMVREQTAFVERATIEVLERLLPVLDDFELALLAADRTKDHESMVRGVEMVYSKLLDELRKDGLERMQTLHEPFDPERHEAVMRADGDGDELIVVDEMRPGYMLRGQILRPAMVKVGPKQE
jgi:molecular chaperone GrpE